MCALESSINQQVNGGVTSSLLGRCQQHPIADTLRPQHAHEDPSGDKSRGALEAGSLGRDQRIDKLDMFFASLPNRGVEKKSYAFRHQALFHAPPMNTFLSLNATSNVGYFLKCHHEQ